MAEDCPRASPCFYAGGIVVAVWDSSWDLLWVLECKGYWMVLMVHGDWRRLAAYDGSLSAMAWEIWCKFSQLSVVEMEGGRSDGACGVVLPYCIWDRICLVDRRRRWRRVLALCLEFNLDNCHTDKSFPPREVKLWCTRLASGLL